MRGVEGRLARLEEQIGPETDSPDREWFLALCHHRYGGGPDPGPEPERRLSAQMQRRLDEFRRRYASRYASREESHAED